MMVATIHISQVSDDFLLNEWLKSRPDSALYRHGLTELADVRMYKRDVLIEEHEACQLVREVRDRQGDTGPLNVL